MKGVYRFITGNYARAIVAGIACGLAGIPIMDAFAHATGKGHGPFSFPDFLLTFVAFITALLVLNFLAGAISHAVASKPVRQPSEAVILGFVAGVALILTELSVFGIRIVSDILDTMNMEGTGSGVVLIDLLFLTMLAILILPGSAVNGVLAALGSLGYGRMMPGVPADE